MTEIRYRYPPTERSPDAAPLAAALREHGAAIATTELSRAETLTSDGVLETVRPEFEEVGSRSKQGRQPPIGSTVRPRSVRTASRG